MCQGAGKGRKNQHSWAGAEQSRDCDGGFNFSWVIERELAGSAAPQSLDDLLWLRLQGIEVLMRLAEEYTGIERRDVEEAGLVDIHIPFTDFVEPGQERISRVLLCIEKALSEGKAVAVCCRGGIGRTGCILACYCIRRYRMSAREALDFVRSRRAAVDCEAMESAVRKYAGRIHGNGESSA